MSKLIYESDLNWSSQISILQLVEAILCNGSPPHCDPGLGASPKRFESSTMSVVYNEIPEYRHSDLKWNGKGDIVKYAESGRHVRNLAFGEWSQSIC